MRDKIMTTYSQTAVRLITHAPRWSRNQLGAGSLAALALMMRLVVPSAALGLVEQKLIQAQAAPPDLQITQVKVLPSPGRATTDVEIRWTAQVPRLTTIDEFDALLDVRYSDGFKAAAHSDQLRSSARAAILTLATHPRQNSTAVLKDFKATLKVRFRIAGSFAVVQQVSAQGDGVRGLSGSSSTSQPEVFITAAKIAQGCSTSEQCVDVKWTAAAPRNMSISEFAVTVNALHKNGTHTTDSRTVGGQDRQVRLHAGPASLDVSSIKVTLLTSFFLLDSKAAVKEGSFSIDSLKG